MSNLSFGFFGTGEIAVNVLRKLVAGSLPPALVITSPDRPVGRKQLLTPSKVKEVALEFGLEILQPEKIDDALCSTLQARNFPVFVVVDYGAILPRKLIDIAPMGIVNMHPSLLPRLRGPSPIRSAIQQDEQKTGVSLMLIDEKIDHGPLLAQKEVTVPSWPPYGKELDALLSNAGGDLLVEVLPKYARGEIAPYEQIHAEASYSSFISKQDGQLDLNDEPYKNLLKIRAYEGWPGTFAFYERNGAPIRVQILDAHIENNPSTKLRAGKLVIDTVKPEGKNEMSYIEFLRSGATIHRN